MVRTPELQHLRMCGLDRCAVVLDVWPQIREALRLCAHADGNVVTISYNLLQLHNSSYFAVYGAILNAQDLFGLNLIVYRF